MIKTLLLLLLANTAFSQCVPDGANLSGYLQRAAIVDNRKADKYSPEDIYGAYDFHNSVTVSTNITITGPLVINSTITAYSAVLTDSPAYKIYASTCGGGGTITTYTDSEGYVNCVHSFASDGTFSPPTYLTTANYLLVGPGGYGGGGNNAGAGAGGGGGAGEVVTGVATVSASMPVVIGQSVSGIPPALGSSSTFAGADAMAGGHGATLFYAVTGGDGANGGGGTGSGMGGSSLVSLYAGGNGASEGAGGGLAAGGGGGGAGGIGGSASESYYLFGGHGGIGYTSSITGTATVYAKGGGGAALAASAGSKGYGGGSKTAGGENGGGYETPSSEGYSNCNPCAHPNSGNGGGGAYAGAIGCSGCSGTVIVSYRIMDIPYRTILNVDGDISAHTIVATASMSATNVYSSGMNLKSVIDAHTAFVSTATGILTAHEVFRSSATNIIDAHTAFISTATGILTAHEVFRATATTNLIALNAYVSTATTLADGHTANLTALNLFKSTATTTIDAHSAYISTATGMNTAFGLFLATATTNLTALNVFKTTATSVIDAHTVGISTAAGLPNNNTFTGLNTFTSSVTVQSIGVKTGTYATTIESGSQTDWLKWTLPLATGTTSQYLTSDGNGNLSWQNIAVFGEQEYYFSNQASDIAGFYNMYSSYPFTTASTITFTSGGTTVSVGTWTTLSGYPSNPIIPDGTWGIHYHAAKISGTKNIALYGKFYKRSSGGVYTFLGQSETSAVMTTVNTHYQLYVTIPAFTLDTGDRLIAEAWATITGGGTDPNIEIYFGGTYYSGLLIPAPAVSITNFVPYTGAIQLLNMGSYGVNTSSNVTAASFIGSGANLTGVITSTAQIVSIQNAHTAALSTAAYQGGNHSFGTLGASSMSVTSAFSVAGSTTLSIANGITTIGSSTTISGSSVTLLGAVRVANGVLSVNSPYINNNLINISSPATSGNSSAGIFIEQLGTGLSARARLLSGVTSGDNPYFSIENRNTASPYAITEKLRIDGYGNVGIGNTTPSAKLDVTGNISASGIFTSSGTGVNTFGSSTTISGSSFTALNTFTVMNGKSGIGTTTPFTPLEIYGNANVPLVLIRSTGAIEGNFSELGFGVSTAERYSGSIRGLRAGTIEGGLAFLTSIRTSATYSDLTERMRINTAGNVSIGNTSPSAKLDVTGNISASGVINSSGTGSYGVSISSGLYVAGFSKIGESGPRIKTVKLTTTTATTEGGVTNAAHGLSRTKILSADVYVQGTSYNVYPQDSDIGAGWYFSSYISETNVAIQLHATNSENILNKLVTILLTYEE